jgi:hypothetical protein
MLVYFKKGFYLVNASIGICYLNDEPTCDLTSNSTQDQIVMRLTITDVNVKLYTVRL